MNLRNLFLINTVVALIFALGLLLGAPTMLTYFGLKAGASENLVAQLLGASLVVPALVSWFARDGAEARRAVALPLFLFDTIGFIVSLLGMFSKVMKPAGWLIVLLFLFFALGYGYFQFMKQSEM